MSLRRGAGCAVDWHSSEGRVVPSALRIEEPKVKPHAEPVTSETSVDEWRRRSVQTADRLKKAEQKIQEQNLYVNQLHEKLRKANARLDEVSALADQRQVELVSVAAERDDLKARVQTQDAIKRHVWELLTGVKDDIDARVGELLGAL
jgi:hypothetical protein